jgi:DNA mismatch repair ATPase MutS
VVEIGHVLKYFYQLHNNSLYNEAFLYSFGFNGYIDCINGIKQNIVERKVHFCKFVDKNKNTVFTNNYYACLKNDNPIKNTVKLKKNIIITGPNASGKTTILKSTIINILFSQQFGCGFYDSAKLKPYDYIHCYLNIPDTSGRDSLFQAEARRCKEILETVNSNTDKSHFCVFDELYSGTNPEEAVNSSTSFMKYLIQNKNVTCILTTHFIKVCKKLKVCKNVINMHMNSILHDNNIKYTYLMKKGISKVKGGIHVLHDMNYPKEILESFTS